MVEVRREACQGAGDLLRACVQAAADEDGAHVVRARDACRHASGMV